MPSATYWRMSIEEQIRRAVEEGVKAALAGILAEARQAPPGDTTGVPQDRAAFTVREVAELLQVAPETVREWFASGRLEGLRTGNRILVWRWSLLELLGAGPTP